MIADTLSRIDALLTILRRTGTVNVNSQETKGRALEVAQIYFSATRPFVVATLGEAAALLEVDENWQALVRLAQGNNARSTYLKVVGKLRKQLAELNVAALSSIVVHRADDAAALVTNEEKLLIATLERLVPSAAASYRQGLLDLRASDRLSYRGTAAEFREALREVLDHLAPDKDVASRPGFKLEPNQGKPTMKQKVKFILSSRGAGNTRRESTEKSAALIEELSGEVTRAVYNRASLATHVQESKNEVSQIKRYVDTVLFDLLEVSSTPG
jgi:hypothetical protein